MLVVHYRQPIIFKLLLLLFFFKSNCCIIMQRHLVLIIESIKMHFFFYFVQLKIFEASLRDLKGNRFRESPRYSKEQHLSEIESFCNIKQKFRSLESVIIFIKFFGRKKKEIFTFIHH